MHKCPGGAACLEENVVGFPPGGSYVDCIRLRAGGFGSGITRQVLVDSRLRNAVPQATGQAAEALLNL